MDKYLLYFLFTCLIMIGCSQEAKRDLQQKPVVGLSTPFQLSTHADTLVLNDYFLNSKRITEVKPPKGLRIDLTKDKKFAVIKGQLSRPMDNISFTLDRHRYDIPVEKPKKKEVTLSFNADQHYKKVSVKGEMNSWNAAESPLKKENGKWRINFKLPPGKYAYKFLADGKEILDPPNNRHVSNGMGGQNSVLQVPGPAQSELPTAQTVSYSADSVTIATSLSANALAYWQNKRLETNIVDDTLHLNIPQEAKQLDRSFIRLWTTNNSGYSNDLLIPIQKGKVLDEPNQMKRKDWEQSVMYFMMIDRFKDGNPANNQKVDNPDILPKANYYGGDLTGVIQKINDGYFDRLGVNTLWLSPITQNPKGAYGQFTDPKTKFSGYHGYWPISSSKIDQRFGSSQEFQELLDTAHQHGMNVILDYVANHVHKKNPVYQQHPDWFTDLYLPDSTMNTQNWESHRLTTWFDTFMPTLDFTKPEVVDAMTDSALFWLKKYPLDGFRHDATKHIPLPFWRTLTQKIKGQVITDGDKRVYQIGETYGSPSLISSYINSGMLDAQFDFNTYDDAVAVFAKDDESMKRLRDGLQQSFKYYGYHNLMGNISGNQDRARFISYAGGDLSFDEDAKKAGWKRNIGVGDKAGYKKLKMLTAFNMTIPGIPIIYYGDEIGMPGGGDPDNRRMMRFKNLSEKELGVRKTTSKLSKLRHERLSLIYGDFQQLQAGDNYYVYARNYFDEWTYVAFNKSSSAMTLTISVPPSISKMQLRARFGSDFTKTKEGIKLTLAPHSFEILTTPTLKSQ